MRIFSKLITTIFISIFSTQVYAAPNNPLLESPDEEVTPYQTLEINIDEDEYMEKVALVPYNYSGQDYLGQLIILDHDDTVLWEGPRLKYHSGQAFRSQDPRAIMSNPLIFGKVGHLFYDLKFAIDPDKDGKFILVAGDEPLGVQIITFRVLRWNGQNFDCLQENCHLIEDPFNPNHYVWSNKDLHSYDSGFSDGRWVRNLQRTNKPNVLKAIIREIKHPFSGSDRSPRFRRGEALMEPEAKGLKIIHWDYPLQKWYNIE